MHENYLNRVEALQHLVAQYYEPGRLDRCYSEVWRKYVYPVYAISYSRFMCVIHIDVAAERARQTVSKRRGLKHDPYRQYLFP